MILLIQKMIQFNVFLQFLFAEATNDVDPFVTFNLLSVINFYYGPNMDRRYFTHFLKTK